MVELRVPARMAVLPVVMVVVMALLVVPQAEAQAVELAQMVAQVPVTQVGILEVAQLVGIPALVPMVGKQVVVLLTDPEAQVVQQMVAQVTAQREALQTEAVVMALDQLEVQEMELVQMVVIPAPVLLMELDQATVLAAPEEALMVLVPDQREVPQVVQLTVAQVTALATEQVQAERQALATAAMVAQEAEMAAVVEMEELAMELGLEKAQALTPRL
jgi:hypothetical protein